MNGIDSQALRSIENLGDVQIRFGSCRGTDRTCFVGVSHVKCSTIYFGVDCDRGNAHLMAGSDDAHRNLATVSDENFLEHGFDERKARAHYRATQAFDSTGAARLLVRGLTCDSRNTARISNS